MTTSTNLFSNDPGVRNDLPLSGDRFDSRSYLARQAGYISEMDVSQIHNFAEIMATVSDSGGTVFFSGNGGSFAIAEHMVCDYAKGMRRIRTKGFNAVCIGSNGPLHSALVNDFGREFALEAELEMYGKQGDVIVAISSSGNSQNIVNVVKKARSIGMTALGLDGFGGGELSQIADHCFTTGANTYPEVEACHQIFLDAVAFTIWTR